MANEGEAIRDEDKPDQERFQKEFEKMEEGAESQNTDVSEEFFPEKDKPSK